MQQVRRDMVATKDYARMNVFNVHKPQSSLRTDLGYHGFRVKQVPFKSTFLSAGEI